MAARVVIAGVGMTPFVKPGQGAPYDALGEEAARMALADAGIGYGDVQQAYAGWVYGDSTAGQKALYRLGMTGIPIVNVNNNCSTGSTALFLARQAVEAGAADCVLALGFEQMAPGALQTVFADRPAPLADFVAAAEEKYEGADRVPMAVKLFAGAGYEYQQRYGAATETFARVRAKASRHAVHNERAIFRRPLSVQEVMDSPRLFLNLGRLDCCPPTCGAAAALVVSDAFAARRGLRRDVAVLGQAMVTDLPTTFGGGDMMRVVGADLTRRAAAAVYEQAGIGPDEVDTVELHDCFTTNEVITYEALGLCPEGGAEGFVRDGGNSYGGRVVTNPSGGLLSKGHPLGATGLAQCAELVWQLRGACGPRQVEGARTALQHNIGLGGAVVVTLYGRA
ncbi:MAG TPA: lipid-transfer protein [Azospirillaceae bacterium]|nr:lipid-transfer protein [Azospirillaceae bacterium]